MSKEKRHILICGDRGVGKSTLIGRLLNETSLPRYGFITKREAEGADGFHPVYIHPARLSEAERVCNEENMIGTCDRRIHNINLSVFNTLGVRCIREAAPDGIIVMDELGFMEADAKEFTDAVFDALSGDIPVIAAVKSRTDVPFLNKVRSMPKAEVFYITPENRDQLFETIRTVFP